MDWREYYNGLQNYFYAYHPPFAFWCAKLLMHLGITDVIVSMKTVSFISSIGAFLCIRVLLIHFGLLQKPSGVFFLYFWASMPLISAMGFTVSIDVIILALTTAAILLTCRIFFPNTHTRSLIRNADCAMLVAVLTIALYSKFSGLTLLPIPIVAAMMTKIRTPKNIALSCCLVSSAILLAMPYYYHRNYKSTGQLFPSNVEFFAPFELQFSINDIKKDPIHYTAKLFEFPFGRLADEEYLDWNPKQARMYDVWVEFWLYNRNFLSSFPQDDLSKFLLHVMPWIVVFGFCIIAASLLRSRSFEREHAFAFLIFFVAGINFAAYIYYLYHNPYPAWRPTKGIYIAPATICIALATSVCLFSHRKLQFIQANPALLKFSDLLLQSTLIIFVFLSNFAVGRF